ncbi:MAG: serine/threonine protein kinase [Clostridia bacterium]|nr:serine/threonine protein kinase [Clostridia bacterium]
MLCDEFIDSMSDSYKKIKLLSNKNGATVIKMRNIRLSKDLVLKKYQSKIEAYDKLRSISHPNLPEIYDALTLDDGQIVLEEYIDGITVAEVLESGLYTYEGAKSVLLQLCSALSTLHKLGIVHRDIKPENIIIDLSGKAKLIDLNASRIEEPTASCDTVLLGTIGYASPEQMGITASDRRADIYALGVLLNVMLTGEHPSKRLARGKAKSIILKCTSISPENRYATVEKLIWSL